MQRCIHRFVVVIYPDTTHPGAIIRALKANNAVALHVMTYSEWLNCPPVAEHILLCIRPDGEWLYAENARAREELRHEIFSE